jgi:hypothetical protein
LKEGSAAFAPTLDRRGVFHVSSNQHRSDKDIDRQPISTAGNHQFAELLNFAFPELPGPVVQHLHLGIEIARFTHGMSFTCIARACQLSA